MYLWHLSRTDEGDYDTYSDAVVVAPTEAEARLLHPAKEHLEPSETPVWVADWQIWAYEWSLKPAPDSYLTARELAHTVDSWPAPDALKVVRLGPADDPTPRVVCTSYHAG